MLLSIENDAKTIKGSKKGFLTGVMYLSPHNEGGVGNTCPWSTRGCRNSCLYTAGHAMIFPTVNEARVRRTRLLAENPDVFVTTLLREIEALKRQAERRGLFPCVRLNGTSDILWEGMGIIESNPSVRFYDYTKAPLSKRKHALSNYTLTYSVSESTVSLRRAKEYLAAGHQAAIVLENSRQVDAVCSNGLWGFPAVNGDLNDLRFLDPPGHWVALKAKGQARRDTSGFVYRIGA